MQLELRPILVATSCDDAAVGERIARTVLKERLAACVQISAPVRSLYWWQDEIAVDAEYLITMKTDRRLFEQISKLICSEHTYDVPEIIATDITAIDAPYARWMESCLKK